MQVADKKETYNLPNLLETCYVVVQTTLRNVGSFRPFGFSSTTNYSTFAGKLQGVRPYLTISYWHGC